ncbi:MAG TPA: hypothetical protein VMB04_14560 [Mycobacterium sp.]|nr:hypothetical protein [Mycobacterium sp.]
MRLEILDRGHRVHAKAIMALIRAFSGHPAVDAVKLAFYRPGFYGAARSPTKQCAGNRTGRSVIAS